MVSENLRSSVLTLSKTELQGLAPTTLRSLTLSMIRQADQQAGFCVVNSTPSCDTHTLVCTSNPMR